MGFRLSACFLVLAGWTTPSPSKDIFEESIAPVLRSHCVQCHGKDGKTRGKVDLLAIRNREDFANHLDLLRDLIDVIDFEEMPPEDESPIPPKARAGLLAALEQVLDESLSGKAAFSQAPVRRMNRFQYHNAVTDLFDLNCAVFTLPERMMREHRDYFRPETGKMAHTVHVGSRPLGKSQLIEKRLAGVAPFPQDLRAEHGFDNRGDHLSLSPLLMEAFLNLGQSITGSPDFGPGNVGIWSDFFAAPASSADRDSEIRRRLRGFLTRAFRRPVEEATLRRYVDYASGSIDSGENFTESMKAVAAAAISSPRFLYLYEDAGTGPVDDFELASRLSFFLWGSLPDETLLDLAAAGDLKRPGVLDGEISRMLADHRLKRFCDSFPSQWLQLERIISSVPDREKFRDFYFSKYRDSMHMMLEPLLLFETVLIENLPVTRLIDSDFTYRSALLNEAYGEGQPPVRDEKGKPVKKRGAVTVLDFHRVPVEDRRFGGLITNAAVMTMTSGPDHTKPITRGAWLATVVFNNPPDPPPADVPPLAEKPPADEEHLSLRERFGLHRERSDCRGCHEQLDPLGFALENFDPVGVWRETYENGREIDVSGSLFRKHEFSNIVEFKDAILAEKDRFTRALAGHLLSFALARETGPADLPHLESIAEATAADDYRLKTLIREVILSEPFSHKTNPVESGE